MYTEVSIYWRIEALVEHPVMVIAKRYHGLLIDCTKMEADLILIVE